ncbi:MAG: alpha/beta hydrolase family protein [Bacillota bacterium]
MSMGIALFILMAALEAALAVITCRKTTEIKDWRKGRLTVRAAQILIAVVAILLPFGQKWRIVPVLTLLAVLALIAAAVALIRRKKAEGTKRRKGVIVSCIISIVLIGGALAPACIFTGYKGLPVSGDYKIKEASAILIDESRTDPFEQDGSCREVPVHFYYPETDGESTDKFPLVIFSHGAFGYYQSNYSTYAELVSNGYVVAALDHPHHAFFTKNSKGKTIIVDRNFMKKVMTINDDSDAKELYGLYQDWMTLRTGDMGFALDEIEAAVRSGSTDGSWYISGSKDQVKEALNEIDTSAVGLMGHSLGGATSVALGRTRDDVGAVIDIDGTMLSEYTGVKDGKLLASEEPYHCPVLEFQSWTHYNGAVEYSEKGVKYPNTELISKADDGYTIAVRDTEHMDFTDLPLLSPFLGKMFGSGERDTAETMEIVNTESLEFLNHYLKGEGEFSPQSVY